jgi:hypothetical protein
MKEIFHRLAIISNACIDHSGYRRLDCSQHQGMRKSHDMKTAER